MPEHSEDRETPAARESLPDGMTTFDVPMTDDDRRHVAEIVIENDLPQFNYYGPADERLGEAVAAYLDQLPSNGQARINAVAGVITAAAGRAQRELGGESAWVMLRVSLPNDSFDIPRWHQDGSYLRMSDGSPARGERKVVWTPKGAPTRFAEIVDADLYRRCDEAQTANFRTNMPDNRAAFHQEEMRIRLQRESAVREIVAPASQAVAYKVGGREAHVHAEPPIHEPRIFLSVVAGTAAQIEEFEGRYGK